MNKVVYKCDCEKNLECSKTSCQIFCTGTFQEEYAVRDEEGKPILEAELIEYEDGTVEVIDYRKKESRE